MGVRKAEEKRKNIWKNYNDQSPPIFDDKH